MRSPRTLNLLAAAAGLVFLTGCATETLTDSAFWSYLPFSSSKGGKGSGGHGGGPALPASGVPQPAPAKADATKRPDKGGGDEGWNEPAPSQTGTDTRGQRPGTSAPAIKPTSGTAATSQDAAKNAGEANRSTPSLPSIGGAASAEREKKTAGLPELEAPQASSGKAPSVPLEGGSGLNKPSRSSGPNPSLPGFPEPTARAGREPLRLPTLIFEGHASAEVVQPAMRDPSTATTPARTQAGLPLPTLATGENRSVTNPATNRLPKGLTEDLQRPAGRTGTLPLPNVLQDKASDRTKDTLAIRGPAEASSPTRSTQAGPKLTAPGEPAKKDAGGAIAKAGMDLGPLAAKPVGPSAGLPDIPAAQPAGEKPIPAPFRLSEWIANDALHQEWRRQQFQRSQLDPQSRGAEQQRLRLVLDYFLVRDRSSEEPAGK